jgi:hypothetical protein
MGNERTAEPSPGARSRATKLVMPEGKRMRVLMGIILGAMLTVGAVYMHDSLITNPATQGSINERPIVNWDVAARDWNDFMARVRRTWARLTSK